MAKLTKNELHALVHKELDKLNGHGLIALCTGAGKTKCAIDYLEKNSTGNILWVVPTEKLRDVNTPDEFRKWNQEEMLERTRMICYHSLPNVLDEKFDYVILDEAHRITSLKYEFFHQNEWNKILCLTATPPYEPEKKAIMHELGLSTAYELTLEKGVELGIIAPFEIILHPVELDDTKTQKIKNGRYVHNVTEKGYYDILDSSYQAMYTHFRNTGIRTQMTRAAVARKQGLSKLATKYRAVRDFLEDNPSDENNRTLVFCGSIKRANEISPWVYHSKSKKDYPRFNNKEIHQLGVVNAANEGLNLVDMHRAVIAQIDASDRNLIQRIGRVVRLRPDHLAEVHIFYYKDTVDEEWVNKHISKLNKTTIHARETYTTSSAGGAGENNTGSSGDGEDQVEGA